MNPVDLGYKIKKIRKQLDISGKELADHAGVTQGTISNIEAGRVKSIKANVLERICHKLEISEDQLFLTKKQQNVKDIDDLKLNLTLNRDTVDLFYNAVVGVHEAICMMDKLNTGAPIDNYDKQELTELYLTAIFSKGGNYTVNTIKKRLKLLGEHKE